MESWLGILVGAYGGIGLTLLVAGLAGAFRRTRKRD